VVLGSVRTHTFHPAPSALVNKETCQLKVTDLTGFTIQLNQCHFNFRMSASTFTLTMSKYAIDMVSEPASYIEKFSPACRTMMSYCCLD
jgi:hypothetical protein